MALYQTPFTLPRPVFCSRMATKASQPRGRCKASPIWSLSNIACAETLRPVPLPHTRTQLSSFMGLLPYHRLSGRCSPCALIGGAVDGLLMLAITERGCRLLSLAHLGPQVVALALFNTAPAAIWQTRRRQLPTPSPVHPPVAAPCWARPIMVAVRLGSRRARAKQEHFSTCVVVNRGVWGR
jgi:hypothetical protein